MTFEADFLHMMDTSVTVYNRASTSGWGTPTWSGSGEALPAHVTYRQRRVLTKDKENVVSPVQLQMPPPGYVIPSSAAIGAGNTVPTIEANDRITLPDGSTRHVLNVTIYTDDTGQHSQTVALQ